MWASEQYDCNCFRALVYCLVLNIYEWHSRAHNAGEIKIVLQITLNFAVSF